MTRSTGQGGSGLAGGGASLGARIRALDAKLGRRSPSSFGPTSKSDRALALIPVLVAVLFVTIVLPRPVEPRDIPLPQADTRVIDAMVHADEARVAAVKKTPLPSSVRALGSAVRTFFFDQANAASPDTLHADRDALTQTFAEAHNLAGDDAILQLRAVDTDEFLLQVARSQQSDGKVARFVSTQELESLAGPFAPRMAEAGYLEDGIVHLSTTELRVFYRALWTSTVGLMNTPPFALSLDETRVRYAVLLGKGRPPSRDLDRLAAKAATRFAGTEEARENERCEREAKREDALKAIWRLDKVRELGALDPSYPMLYSMGILSYQRGEYTNAVNAFRAWTEQHPDGAYSLRAANYLRASMREAEKER